MAITCPKCQHENPDDTIYCGKCATPLKSAEEISITNYFYALFLSFNDRYDDALEAFRTVLEIDPTFEAGRVEKLIDYRLVGQIQDQVTQI
jgi:lipoprotein NlpI